jgi:DNA-binding protein WhiA
MPLATPMSLDALASLGASGSSDAPTSLCVPEPVGVPELLAALGILTSKNQIVDGIKRDLIRTKCCRGSYLRGALLGGGSVSGPDSDYHLEMAVGNEKLGQDLMALTNRFPGLHAKLGRRKQSFLVYLKGSDQIADFLTVTGAHGSLLEFESARVMKGMKNQVNRLVNCETANMDKALDAAFRQMSNIRLIDERIGLDSLDPSLAQIARLRLDNPDANLKELGEIMMPAVGKSGVNHRFRKIEEIAEGLRK